MYGKIVSPVGAVGRLVASDAQACLQLSDDGMPEPLIEFR